MSTKVSVVLLSEDQLSDAVLRRLVSENGRLKAAPESGPVGGFGNLKKRARAFNYAAQYRPAIFLTDLDSRPCCMGLIQEWLGNAVLHRHFLLRIAVREVESWLFADAESLAEYLRIPLSKIPNSVDDIEDPQQTMFNLARMSKSSDIRKGLPPKVGQKVGPDYNQVLSHYVSSKWNPKRAGAISPSLRRARMRIIGFDPNFD